MNEETEKFHDMLQDFERYCSIKLKKEAVSSFVQLLKWLAKHEPTASSRGKEWQHFIAYCRCQIVSCYATLLMQRLQQAGNRAGLSEANTIILVCYSYSMVLQLAPSLKSIPKDTWWSANCVFCILEAHQMLSSLLLKREVKEEFFAALKSSALTDLVAKTAAIFTLNPRFKTDELFGMFGDNPCQRKVDLDVDAYRSAIRYLIRHDTTPVALKRLVWILLFSWDPGKELIMRNDHEDAFDMLPYAPGDFADTSFENLTVLDISVFIHLSVFSAASSKGQLEKLPFVLSCNVAVKKMREAVWTSVNAYVAGRTGPKDVENIKQFLCYIRLTQRPLPCLSLLHTAAKMIYNKTDELGSFLTKDAKLKVIDYCNAYWCAIEDIIKGEKRAQDDSYRFAFCERPFSSEEQQSMLDESFFYRAKLLLHRGEPIEAERMLRNCTSPTAARLHLELCKQLADSIDSNDPSLENQCRKENYQKLISNISEKLSTGTDGFDESILSNQEASLIESATKQKFTFAKKESRKPTDFQSNEPTFVGRHHQPKNCECRESFEKLFDAYQQILLKFGSVIETIPDMFSTSVKCIADQNKELMLFLQDLLKSGTLTTEKKAPQVRFFASCRKYSSGEYIASITTVRSLIGCT
ncbi:hypothetical protein TTRE_0000412101 [Trichuris trichiura]|uniref:Uncharacterized protein n=1 Tax=Trichuris trichiura TaxID=36087 RepID=A0A077Z5W2_TRITR|nr:hypothetical protein TTRE_0000412101 [Trichuris trichiura]